MRTVTATRYVTPLREGGSLPALMEADDDGLYVVKFSGAGQGPKALVAELVGGEIGRALGLPVPEIVLVEVDPAPGRAEPDSEIRELLERSAGANLGLDFLPGALTFAPSVDPPLPPGLAAEIIWFDALITNIDRTPKNPNMLTWHGRPWLIDHGAALYIQHRWLDWPAHARRPFGRVRDHILLPSSGPLRDEDERLTALLDTATLTDILDLVPDAWLSEPRDRYVEYLERRLSVPRPFVEEADRARDAA
jgi:hypothetical protein